MDKISNRYGLAFKEFIISVSRQDLNSECLCQKKKKGHMKGIQLKYNYSNKYILQDF